jgi:hypothetical protein
MRGAAVIALAGVIYTCLFMSYAYRFVLEAGARQLAIGLIKKSFPAWPFKEAGIKS